MPHSQSKYTNGWTPHIRQSMLLGGRHIAVKVC